MAEAQPEVGKHHTFFLASVAEVLGKETLTQNPGKYLGICQVESSIYGEITGQAP